MLQIEILREHLTELGLKEMARTLEYRLQEAVDKDQTYFDFLNTLVEEELSARKDRAFKTRLSMARLPFQKTIADFDFSFFNHQ